jgi:hypothetical protein
MIFAEKGSTAKSLICPSGKSGEAPCVRVPEVYEKIAILRFASGHDADPDG